MKIKTRLFCILAISTLIISSCGAPQQDFSNTETPETVDTVSTHAAQATPNPFFEKYGIAVVATDNEKYPVLAVDKSGERLVAVTDSESSGNINTVTGAVWFSADGDSFVLFNGDDGLPEKVVVGELTIIFLNYTDDTVDLGIIGPDSTTEIVQNISVDPNDLSELRALQKQTFNPVKSSILAKPNSFTTADQLVEYLKIVGLGLSVASCVIAIPALTSVTLGAALGAIAIPCGSAIIDAVQYITDDGIFPASTGLVLDAMDAYYCLGKNDLFSCIAFILSATEKAISAAQTLIASLEEQISTIYTKISFATYQGDVSYKDKTTVCTCRNCGEKDLHARLIISEDGFVTGELVEFVPLISGPRDNITGVITWDESNNCNSICTYTLTGKLTNNDRTFKGIIDETCTPGNCEFDKCVGTYTFSLDRK